VLRSQYPGGFEFHYLTAPLRLLIPVFPTESFYGKSTSDSEELQAWAWWKALDVVSEYPELPSTLLYLHEYIQQAGPFDGVLGFSQGGALAVMLTSWCEATIRPARRKALGAQRVPVTLDPPQAPFKFAICVSGYCSSPQYYKGFYDPQIQTPILHITAEWDIMVSSLRSRELTSTMGCVQVLHHPGGHYVPTGTASCSAAAKFIERQWNLWNGELAYDSDSSCDSPSLLESNSSPQSSSRSSRRPATFKRVDGHQRRVLRIRRN
jgi:hypothetical protein